MEIEGPKRVQLRISSPQSTQSVYGRVTDSFFLHFYSFRYRKLEFENSYPKRSACRDIFQAEIFRFLIVSEKISEM